MRTLAVESGIAEQCHEKIKVSGAFNLQSIALVTPLPTLFICRLEFNSVLTKYTAAATFELLLYILEPMKQSTHDALLLVLAGVSVARSTPSARGSLV